jgi:predicted Zn-dependent peptidase
MHKWLLPTLLFAISIVAASGQTPDRNQAPGSGSSPTLAPVVVKRQLSNGLPVWIVEQHELPVVQMSLQVLTGTAADPPGRYGLASLASAMLTQGAGSRSGIQIAEALDAQLANLSASSSIDSSSLQLYVPVLRLPDVLPLMADVAQRPTFPKEELERVRQQRLLALSAARDDPDTIAALAFARGIYGPSHRNAAAEIGTADSIKAVTPEDLRAFHHSAYRPAASTLIVVGDVTPKEVLPLLETHFGKWQPAQSNGIVREPAPALPRPARQLVLVDMPNAPQSRILIGSVGASSSMSDFFPIQLLNTVLRARFSSGRNATLRDYTAGVRSGFDLRKSAGPFVVAAAAETGKTAEVLGELLNELAAVLKGIPADELARAKDEIAVQFPRMFEASGRISNRLKAMESLVVYGLPDDHYVRYVPAIQAVGAADVQRVAQQYMQPDHLTMVIVGARKTIEQPLRALNLGSIKDVSRDEVLAPAR